MTKEGALIKAIYARQNGAMILLGSNAPRLLNEFMIAQGKPSMKDLVSMVKLTYQDAPIARVDAQLPLPLRGERLFTRL